MVGHGARLVNAFPAEQAGAPGQVDVGRPALEVGVQDLALDRAPLERFAPVQGGRSVDPER